MCLSIYLSVSISILLGLGFLVSSSTFHLARSSWRINLVCALCIVHMPFICLKALIRIQIHINYINWRWKKLCRDQTIHVQISAFRSFIWLAGWLVGLVRSYFTVVVFFFVGSSLSSSFRWYFFSSWYCWPKCICHTRLSESVYAYKRFCFSSYIMSYKRLCIRRWIFNAGEAAFHNLHTIHSSLSLTHTLSLSLALALSQSLTHTHIHSNVWNFAEHFLINVLSSHHIWWLVYTEVWSARLNEWFAFNIE